MTLDEYKRIGEKYELEYSDYEECFFSKGHKGDYRFVVSIFKGAPHLPVVLLGFSVNLFILHQAKQFILTTHIVHRLILKVMKSN